MGFKFIAIFLTVDFSEGNDYVDRSAKSLNHSDQRSVISAFMLYPIPPQVKSNHQMIKYR